MPTLSQRLSAIKDILKKTKGLQDDGMREDLTEELLENLEDSDELGVLLLSDGSFCIICGLVRLNLDPTGVTCGSEQCLGEIKSKINELEDKESELQVTISEAKSLLEDIVDILKIDHESFNQDVVSIAFAVRQAVRELSNTVKELERYITIPQAH